MAVFGGLMLTNSGRNLDAKTVTGKTLKFKRIALGDGTLGLSESMITLTKLKHEVLSQNITEIKVVQDNIVKITFQLTNTNLEEGFTWREIGLIAEDPDTQAEVLFCYGNAGENGEYISAGGETDILEKYINLDIIVSNVESVTAVIDESLIFATQKDLKQLEEKMKNQIIVSEEEPEQNECIWYQILKSKSVASEMTEIMVEVADVYDENSTYQLETITNMTNDETDETNIIEKEDSTI